MARDTLKFVVHRERGNIPLCLSFGVLDVRAKVGESELDVLLGVVFLLFGYLGMEIATINCDNHLQDVVGRLVNERIQRVGRESSKEGFRRFHLRCFVTVIKVRDVRVSFVVDEEGHLGNWLAVVEFEDARRRGFGD